jgi:hypothetical protein
MSCSSRDTFRFVADTSGRWICINTLVAPAEIVHPDFMAYSWREPQAPVMMGSEGPWSHYAHACSVAGDNKVFVAGVYTLGGQGASSNAVVMLDLPLPPASSFFTPAIIAAISCAAALHLINAGAVLLYIRRSEHCSGCKLVLLWSLAALVLSSALPPLPLPVLLRLQSRRNVSISHRNPL